MTAPNSTFVPGPAAPADEMTEAWWAAAAGHRLTAERCAACGHCQHPPRSVCTACSATDGLTQVEVSGAGVVDSFTVVYKAPRPDVETPYVLARVRLDEGPLLLTRLVGGLDWTIGDAVVVDWVDLDDGRAVPYFRIPTRSS